MNRFYVIALDVGCAESAVAVLSPSGRVVRRERCATRIPALVDVIERVATPRHLVMEEGSMADWLWRHLRPHVQEAVVSDPRRNHLVARDGDKDDPIDAGKLGLLYQGGFVRRVHHPETLARQEFKQTVLLYHDRVRQRVRQANQVMAMFRECGERISERRFARPEEREALLRSTSLSLLYRAQLRMLWDGYDGMCDQVRTMRRMVIRLAKRESAIRAFVTVPGYKWIRAATFFVCVDTPWRFRNKSALWKYLGIGLERRHSSEGPTYLRVPIEVNRPLKNVVHGAARSAIASGDNPFADQHRRWRDAGLTPRNARRNVARSQATMLWSLWKTGGVYRPEWVGADWMGRAGMSLQTG